MRLWRARIIWTTSVLQIARRIGSSLNERRDARSARALRASNYLADIPGALRQNAGHLLAYRQMLAPPLSQDQFSLVCPGWSKQAENTGRALAEAAAAQAAGVIAARLDRGAVRWDLSRGKPAASDVKNLLRVTSALMAVQQIATARRGRVALAQEQAVVAMLEQEGWTRLPSRLIDTRAAVPARSYMHKTRFATNTTTHQEVDIACGLNRSYVLAMECKVTNDETNSVKRVNDVLKKATAWKLHWGSFVVTAALLQGVIAPKDVQRLSDAGIHVFWSHALNEFRDWLLAQVA